MSFDSDPPEEMWHSPAVTFCAFDAWLRPLFGSVYSERKCVLFGVACCCRVVDRWGDSRVRVAVDAAERFADTDCVRRLRENWCTEPDAGTWCTDEESVSAHAQLVSAREAIVADRVFRASFAGRLAEAVVQWPGWQLGSDCCHRARELLDGTEAHSGTLPDFSAFAPLLRDVFPNPYRPVSFLPRWRTDTSILLARLMYDARDFSSMPILADALQDAGCDNEEVLNHCRDTKQVHVRGCWVVDLVLGKE